MSDDRPIKIGSFIAPYHAMNDDPTLAIRRNLDLVRHLDQMGYDEAWIGEHHSAGVEIISSPELFIAAAAELTTHITLGTGVISLPYHNPLMVADRILQLDHQTRGRVKFGIGPGILPSDADMLCIPADEQRARMVEAVEVIIRLLDGEEVTAKGAWYELNKARCHLRPFTYPRPQMFVASSFTPNGAQVAGRLDLGLLCMSATGLNGFKVLDVNWAVAEAEAAKEGRVMDRQNFRVVGPMHLAETKEQALKDVEWGMGDFLGYFGTVAPLCKAAAGATGLAPSSITDAPAAEMSQIDILEQGFGGTIGTPDDAIATLERLWEKTGGFGGFLLQDHNWADFEATKKSYELFARYVRPWFKQANKGREASLEAYRVRNDELMGNVYRTADAAIKGFTPPSH